MDRRFFLRTLGLLALSTLTACFRPRDYDSRDRLSGSGDLYFWDRDYWYDRRRYYKYNRHYRDGDKRPHGGPPHGKDRKDGNHRGDPIKNDGRRPHERPSSGKDNNQGGRPPIKNSAKERENWNRGNQERRERPVRSQPQNNERRYRNSMPRDSRNSGRRDFERPGRIGK